MLTSILERLGATGSMEGAMVDVPYISDSKDKIRLRLSRRPSRRAALAPTLALGGAGVAEFGRYDLTTGRYLESTDDAYVQANSTIIAPKVSGYLAQVLVADNEPVKAGQLLARIDDRDVGIAVLQTLVAKREQYHSNVLRSRSPCSNRRPVSGSSNLRNISPITAPPITRLRRIAPLSQSATSCRSRHSSWPSAIHFTCWGLRWSSRLSQRCC